MAALTPGSRLWDAWTAMPEILSIAPISACLLAGLAYLGVRHHERAAVHWAWGWFGVWLCGLLITLGPGSSLLAIGMWT